MAGKWIREFQAKKTVKKGNKGGSHFTITINQRDWEHKKLEKIASSGKKKGVGSLYEGRKPPAGGSLQPGVKQFETMR